MTIRKKTLVSMTVALILLATVTTFVNAHTPTVAGTPSTALPPLPEWPIIGPVLRFLGVVEETAPEAIPTPDPSLPEYRITALEDIDQLREVEPNKRIRITATDTDLNQMIRDVLSETNFSESANLTVTFTDATISADAYANATIIEQTGVDLPAALRGNFDVSATFTAGAANCMANVTFEKIKANGWGFGLRTAANRLVNEQIPEFWPEELCVETVIVMEGEASVEGYLTE